MTENKTGSPREKKRIGQSASEETQPGTERKQPGLFNQLFEFGVVFAVDLSRLFDGGNIGGFAQASDDTRAVISFMHENQVPVDFETAVPCVPSDDIFYDLSISEQSGLQVPKNYVNGGEREFFVNVGNLGPDPANGTVTVVATANGETLDCGVATDCTWTLSIEELLAGQTASFTVFFTISTSSDTINWTATVVADPPGTDPNPGNNSVDAVSNVRASGGGGGH